ncbi:putative 1-acylglycerol-3-phosphate O-acyltransferase [Colletotrichum siamense]|uniref:1-acylglycerol-3-phosphate O-acyltransferase n=1 Tax=Colletotrichum siamense TaxID=690259 RepID=A0A9P5EMD2_COLSI|nr:putative 1-acylglycerol-3-phosphate O-acyltransferase [Colletotrichum siamense]KAF4854481.1 putative 1-acylglycerol-3-phosphate O-acyltransferase [Colletotrichum siamense]
MMTSAPTSGYITTSSGTKTHYLLAGDPSGPPLVCLHGLGGSTQTFERLLPVLPSSYKIVLVDFQGLGKTPLADQTGKLTIAGHVADLHDLLTSLQESPQKQANASKAIIIGHSLGAIVALHYAAQHPDNVAGLALLGPGRAIGHIPAARQRMLDLAANVREKGILFGAEMATKSNFYEDTPDRSADPVAREAVHKMVAASDPEGYAQTCEALADLEHADPDYSAIKCPAVFIAGDKDMISPVERSRELSKLLGGESWVEVVTSGHQPIIEDLKAVEQAVTELLGKVVI